VKEVEDEANEEQHGMHGTQAVDTEATVSRQHKTKFGLFPNKTPNRKMVSLM